MKIVISEQRPQEPEDGPTTPTDRLYRASWTAEYKDGFYEIVVPQQVALDEVAKLERKLADLEEREAACCPENVGFEEYITILKKQNEECRRRLSEALDPTWPTEEPKDFHKDDKGNWYPF